MTTIEVCDICNEPTTKALETVTAAMRTSDRHSEYHFHRSCLDQRIPGLWVLAGDREVTHG